MLRDLTELSAIIVLAIVLLILAVFPLVWITNVMKANSLNALGYEAKVVNFNCYAKYKERWLTCSAVVDR